MLCLFFIAILIKTLATYSVSFWFCLQLMWVQALLLGAMIDFQQ